MEEDCFPKKMGIRKRNEVAIAVFESIQRRGWMPLRELEGPDYEEIVREFYVNMKVHDDGETNVTYVVG
jgi:hypothetical protein